MNKTYPYILIVGSLIGLLASFFLMLDTITLIKNPTAEIPCNLNPFISCGNAILSEQGQVFGFPNPLLGIVSFSMLLAIGIMLLSHSRSRKPLWLLVNLGTLASMIFVVWFFYQSLYNLGTLCLYCMVVWVVTWPIFLYTTVWNQRESNFSFCQKCFNFISKYHLQILVSGYLIAILLILFKFQDYFF